MKAFWPSQTTSFLDRVRQFLLSPYCLALLFLVFLGLRVIYIAADPPKNLSWSLGLFFDDGLYHHNARNQILFGQRELDEWNDYYYSVISYWIKYLILRVIGVGRVQIRLISVLFSLVSLLFFYLGCKESYDRPTGLLAALLLGTNYVYVMYNRLGLQDTHTVAVFMLAFYLWQRGMKALATRRGRGYFLLAGIVVFVTYTFKNLFIFLLPVPFAALLVMLGVNFRNPARRRPLLHAFGLLSAGSLLAFGTWFLTFYLAYKGEIARIGGYMLDRMMLPSTEIEAIALNLYKTPFFRYFSWNPVVLGCALAAPLVLYAILCSDLRAKLHPSDVFLFMWFFAALAFLSGLAYRPLRWFLPIIPPMCGFTARGILQFSRARSIQWPRHMHWTFFPGACAWIFVGIHYTRTPYARLIQPRSVTAIFTPLLFMNLALAFLVTGLVAGGLRWRAGRKLDVPGMVMLAPGILAALFSVYADGKHYYGWIQAREYTIPTVGRDLERYLGTSAYIAGLDAPSIAYNTPYKTLYTWDRFVNYRDNPFHTYGVTHLFLSNDRSTGEQDFYVRKYPEIMEQATLLQQYRLKDVEFNLFSLVEPRLEAIAPPASEFQVSEPLAIDLRIQNYDFRDPAKAYLNWQLFPVDSQEITQPAATGREVQMWIPAGQGRTVTVDGIAPTISGRYRLFASWKPPQQERYEAEDMETQVGIAQPDPHASGGRAMRHDRERQPHPGFLAYGRYYRDYQPGTYEAVFRLRVQNGAPTDETLVRLDVAAQYGQYIIRQRMLKRADFAPRDAEYQLFILPFVLDTYTSKLELRVYSEGQTDVWADDVALIYREGHWSDDILAVK